MAICTKFYIDGDGKEYRALPEDPSNIIGRLFKFSNGTQRLIEPKNFPKNSLHGAVLTGLGYVGSASLNNAGGDVKKAIQLFDDRLAKLSEGIWATRGTGGVGGRDSLIVAAVLAAAEEADREVDEDKVRAHFVADDIKGEGDKAEKARSKARAERKTAWRKRADVEAHYQRIRAERTAEAATRAAGKVSDDAEPVEGADFGDLG